MKGFARAIRVKHGRKAVEPGLSDALTSQKEMLRDFYDYEMMESTKSQKINVESPRFIKTLDRALVKLFEEADEAGGGELTYR